MSQTHPGQLPAPGTQLAIPNGWVQLVGYRQTKIDPVPMTICVNKSNIVSVRKTSATTCHLHVVDKVDYHITMTYEQVVTAL